ncbi:MAG: hypothetical protein EBT33_17785 [Betaproteobacteria bacterium]|nr:hypothetical protein [Betaproteobacteria bacterium]
MDPDAWRALMDRAPLIAAVKQAGEHFDPDDNRFFSGSGLRGAALRDVSGQMTVFGMLLNAVIEVVDETSPTGDAGAVEAWRSLPSVAANPQVLDEIADLLGMDLQAMRAQA